MNKKKVLEKGRGEILRRNWGGELFFLILAAVLSLGQLERIALNQKIAFYLHDVLILGWLIASIFLPKLRMRLLAVLVKTKQYFIAHQKLKLMMVMSGVVLGAIIIAGWVVANIQGNFSFISLLYTIRYGTYVLFGLSVFITQPLKAKSWAKVLIVYALLTILLSAGQYLFWPDTRELLLLGYDDHYGRLIGPLLDPNMMGLILGLLFLTLINWRSRKHLFFRLILGLVLFMLLLCTYSRSAYLALLVGLIVTIAIQWTRPKTLTDDARGDYRAALFFLPLSKSDDSINLLRTNSWRVRLIQAEQALQSLTWENWFLGRGLFVAPDYEINWLTEPAAMTKITANFGDNFFLIQLSFFGVVGGLMMLTFYAWLTIWLYRQPRWRKVLPLWLAWLTSAQFINAFYQPTVIILMVLLVVGIRASWQEE